MKDKTIKPKTKKVPLTDDELKEARLMADELSMKRQAMEFNISQAKRALKLNIPQRSAEREVRQIEEELNRVKYNEKYFARILREKTKEVADNS
jgi:hypothetical protein